MFIRLQELKRLDAYAKALGVKVQYSNKKVNGCSAEWFTDGTKIVLYNSSKVPKVQLVLSFIHELGHHVHWIDTGKKPSSELLQALISEANRKHGEILDKNLRKLIYEDEHQATHYWDKIVKLLDIRIKPARILEAKKLDLFTYRHYYETGEFPNSKQIKEYKNEIRKTKRKQSR